MTDWRQQIHSRTRHSLFVLNQTLEICDEHPLATIAIRSRLAAAITDLTAVDALLDVDDRGLELAEDILHRARQADDPRVIAAGDNRLTRALSALDRLRKAIRGDG